MAQFHVTLKSELSRGALYWVCDVAAKNEDEALAIAEEQFFLELDNPSEWSFTDSNIEPA